ncbi:MAG: hypothetical protein WA989_12365, partial [Henriciella sp.]|uniref:hypothetical protein n=1 Tax=Henriciella sp. TaxID=1968823 RepID=UPI003C77DA10
MNTKVAMQSASDAATIAAAIELLKDASDEEVRRAAMAAMQTKVSMEADGLACTMEDFSISEHRDAVRAGWTCNEPSAITAAIGKESMQFPVATTAMYHYGMDGCVLALGEHNPTGVAVTGSAAVTLESCAVISNSRKDTSIDMGGSGTLSTTCAYAAGGIENGSVIYTTDCISPIAHGRPTPDPYADLEMPEDWTSWPCISPTKVSKNDIFLTWGRYCSPVSGKDDIE